MAKKTSINLSDEDKRLLKDFMEIPGQKESRKKRAQIILLWDKGIVPGEISKELGLKTPTVRSWQKRWLAKGLDGLSDRPRDGRSVKYEPEDYKKLLETIKTEPPEGEVFWTGKALEAKTGMNASAIWKYTHDRGIKLSRTRLWRTGTAPAFGEKSAEIVALYLSHRECAFLVKVSTPRKKPSFQRSKGIVLSPNSKTARKLKSASRSDIPLTLSGAIKISMEHNLKARKMRPRTKSQLPQFVEDAISVCTTEKGDAFHLIADGTGTVLVKEKWQKLAHPITCHFLPNRKEWLDVLTLWSDIFGTGQMRIEVNDSIDIRQAVESFLKYSESYPAERFRWIKEDLEK
ncbi:MAG: helix-turn-helix domain-containing protein [Burkholderiales bacterium]|nr:helix-turn-helix domain-containing protein [Burkholderiales bacterium]